MLKEIEIEKSIKLDIENREKFSYVPEDYNHTT